MNGKNIFDCLATVSQDSRLTVWHIGVLVGILYLGRECEPTGPIQISRQRIMDIAHISNPTYHKCIRELVTFGYIEYQPSYHPANGSRVKLLI